MIDRRELWRTDERMARSLREKLIAPGEREQEQREKDEREREGEREREREREKL